MRILNYWSVLILLLGTIAVKANSLYSIPRGKTVDTIKCIDDRKQSYALYLPSFYTVNNKYPILYIFEPAARGSLPVTKYQKIAEEYGFILVCSNNSRNGPQQLSNIAANAIFNDSRTRFTIDTSRIYTMGFSGGARVATRLAVEQGNIKGVIACGAGFPYNHNPSSKLRFTFIGLIGDTDMNYFEMKHLEKQLSKAKMKYLMLHFKDDHSWPSEEQMKKAFRFLHFDAMQRKMIEPDSVLIQKFKEKELCRINKQDTYSQYVDYKNLLKYLIGLTKTDKIQLKINELSQDQAINDKMEREDEILEQETLLSGLFGNAIYKPEEFTMQWWKIEASKLNKAAKDSSYLDVLMVAKRMKNKIYSMAFELYFHKGENLKLNESIRFFKIASLAIPESPYPDYYMASIYATNEKDGLSVKYLRKSIDKGFSNFKYLKQDKSFDKIRMKKKFIELEKLMDNK